MYSTPTFDASALMAANLLRSMHDEEAISNIALAPEQKQPGDFPVVTITESGSGHLAHWTFRRVSSGTYAGKRRSLSFQPVVCDPSGASQTVDYAASLFGTSFENLKTAIDGTDASDQLKRLGREYARLIPSSVTEPSIWGDEDEVAFEWVSGRKHAILTIESDGSIGYAMRSGDLFVPGAQIATSNQFPEDLLKYLREA